MRYKNYGQKFLSFYHIHSATFDEKTDRRTDGQISIARPRVCIHSRTVKTVKERKCATADSYENEWYGDRWILWRQGTTSVRVELSRIFTYYLPTHAGCVYGKGRASYQLSSAQHVATIIQLRHLCCQNLYLTVCSQATARTFIIPLICSLNTALQTNRLQLFYLQWGLCTPQVSRITFMPLPTIVSRKHYVLGSSVRSSVVC